MPVIVLFSSCEKRTDPLFVLKSDTEPDLVAVSAKEEKLVPIAIATAQLKSDLFNFIIFSLK